MDKDTALRLALEALKEDRAWLETDAPTEVWEKNNEAITASKAALLSRSDGEAKDEPVAHSVVAGALFDFMGWLTSREKRLILSSVDEASPAVEAITEFAKKRNLSLKYAEVGYWMEFLSTPPQQEAKDEPVAWIKRSAKGNIYDLLSEPDDGYEPVYTTPPKRIWVGLTDEEISELIRATHNTGSFVRAIEAKLKQKNFKE